MNGAPRARRAMHGPAWQFLLGAGGRRSKCYTGWATSGARDAAAGKATRDMSSLNILENFKDDFGFIWKKTKDDSHKVVTFLNSYLASNAAVLPDNKTVVRETGCSIYVVKRIMSKLHGSFGKDELKKDEQHLDKKMALISQTSCEDEAQFDEKLMSARQMPFEGAQAVGHMKSVNNDVASLEQIESQHELLEETVLGDNNVEDVHENRPINEENSNQVDFHRESDISMPKESFTSIKESYTSILGQLKEVSEDSFPKKTFAGIFEEVEQAFLREKKARNLQVEPQRREPYSPCVVASRRVYVSPKTGIENDLSWTETIKSVMPDAPSRSKEEPLNEQNEELLKSVTCESKQPDQLKEKLSTEYWQHLNACTSRRFRLLLSSPLFKNVSKTAIKTAIRGSKGVTKISVDQTNRKVLIDFKTEQDLNYAWNRQPFKLWGKAVHAKKLGEESVIEKSPTEGNMAIIKDRVIKCGSELLVPSPDMTITIDKCSTGVSPEIMEHFFSRCGKVASYYVEITNEGKQTMTIQFEDQSGKENACSIQKFVLDGHYFELRCDVPSNYMVIRLQNVSSNIAEDTVKQLCEELPNCKAAHFLTEDVVDVHFELKGRSRLQDILNSLNAIVVDGKGWQAAVVYEGFDEVSCTQDNCGFCLQHQLYYVELVSLTKQLVALAEKVCKG